MCNEEKRNKNNYLDCPSKQLSLTQAVQTVCNTYIHTYVVITVHVCIRVYVCVCTPYLPRSVWPSSAAGDSPARAAAVLEISKSKPQTDTTHFTHTLQPASSRIFGLGCACICVYVRFIWNAVYCIIALLFGFGELWLSHLCIVLQNSLNMAANIYIYVCM